MARKQRRIEDYATVEAHCAGAPVRAFGYTYVYAVSPDLLPGVVWQDGNNSPRVKIRPKKFAYGVQRHPAPFGGPSAPSLSLN